MFSGGFDKLTTTPSDHVSSRLKEAKRQNARGLGSRFTLLHGSFARVEVRGENLRAYLIAFASLFDLLPRDFLCGCQAGFVELTDGDFGRCADAVYCVGFTLCRHCKSLVDGVATRNGYQSTLSRLHRPTTEKIVPFNITKIPEQFGISLLLTGIKRAAS